MTVQPKSPWCGSTGPLRSRQGALTEVRIESLWGSAEEWGVLDLPTGALTDPHDFSHCCLTSEPEGTSEIMWFQCFQKKNRLKKKRVGLVEGGVTEMVRRALSLVSRG